MIPSVDITTWLEVKSSMEEDNYQWKKVISPFLSNWKDFL